MKKVLQSLAVVTVVLVAVLAFGVGCAGPAYVSGKRVAPAVPEDIAHLEGRMKMADGKGPARTASELLGAIAQIREKGASLSVPLLTLHGSEDKVTPPAGSAWLVEQAASKDKTNHPFPGLVHDLMHEPERAQVFEVILGWLDTH